MSVFAVIITDELGFKYNFCAENNTEVLKIIENWITDVDSTPISSINIVPV